MRNLTPLLLFVLLQSPAPTRHQPTTDAPHKKQQINEPAEMQVKPAATQTATGAYQDVIDHLKT